MLYSLTEATMSEIKNTIGMKTVESGGLLGSASRGIIDEYIFDPGKLESTIEFAPNVDYMQRILMRWSNQGIRFLGIIHSHIMGSALSDRDILMARRILECNEHIDYILMPVFTIMDQRITWYKVGNNCVNAIEVEMPKGK